MRSLRAPFVVLFALMAVLAVACGDSETVTGGPFAAKVNGDTISTDAVEDELAAIAANDQYVGAIEASGVTVRGEGEGTFDSAFVAQILTRQIAFLLISQEIDELGLEVTEADVESARNAVSAQVGGQEVFDAFDQSFQDLLARRTAEVSVLQAGLAEIPAGAEAARAFYDENRDLFAEACASHILLETEEAANDVIARIQGGADFAEIARTESIDTGSGANGGDLGCAPRGVYVPEFEDAIFESPVGEVVGPVATQFGFHVIRVDERTIPPFDEIQDEVANRLAQQGEQAFGEFIQEAFDTAEVEVNPRFGSWATGVQPGVVPPTPPTTTAGDDGGIDDLINPPGLGG